MQFDARHFEELGSLGEAAVGNFEEIAQGSGRGANQHNAVADLLCSDLPLQQIREGEVGITTGGIYRQHCLVAGGIEVAVTP